jgi:hypothetical protein
MPFKRTNLIELSNLKSPLQKNTELVLHLSSDNKRTLKSFKWCVTNQVWQHIEGKNTEKLKDDCVKDKTLEKYHNVSHFPSTVLHLQGDPNMNPKHDGIVD